MLSMSKRRFEEDEVELEVELTLKRKKPRILPLRLSPPYPHHHHPAPADSPLFTHPTPPVLTPAQSDDDEHLGPQPYPGECSTIPDIRADEVPNESADEDLDMLDSRPIYSPAGPGMLSPYMTSNRIPTPRYGSFFLRPPAEQAGSAVVMGDADDVLPRPMGPRSRHTTIQNRVLPSPINEGDGWGRHLLSPIGGADEMMGRLAVGTEEHPGAAEIEGSEKDRTHDPPRARSEANQYPRRSTPMLIMGYRADCEKCRARVPGHYSHIVRT